MQHTKISRFPLMPIARKRLIANTLLSWSRNPRIRTAGKDEPRSSLGEIARRCAGAEGAAMSPIDALQAQLDPASGHSEFLDILGDFGRQLVLEAYLARRPHQAFVRETGDLHSTSGLTLHATERSRCLGARQLADLDLYAVGRQFTLLGTELASFETGAVFTILERNAELADGCRLFTPERGNDLLGQGDIDDALLQARDALVGITQDEAINDALFALSGEGPHTPLRQRPENAVVAIAPCHTDNQSLPAGTARVANPFRDMSSWFMARCPQVAPAIELAFGDEMRGPQISVVPDRGGIRVDGTILFGARVVDPTAIVRTRLAA